MRALCFLFATIMNTHHTIDYIEFTVTNMAAAQAFYASAFDWSFTDYGPGYAGIHRAGDAEHEMGGFCLGDTTNGGGGPLVVLYSEDLQATLSKVRKAGGNIRKEIFDFPGGKRFEFEDPSGNVLAVWTKK